MKKANYRELQRIDIKQAAVCYLCRKPILNGKGKFMSFTPRPKVAIHGTCGLSRKISLGNSNLRKNKKEHAARRKAERKIYKETVLIPKWKAKYAICN